MSESEMYALSIEVDGKTTYENVMCEITRKVAQAFTVPAHLLSAGPRPINHPFMVLFDGHVVRWAPFTWIAFVPMRYGGWWRSKPCWTQAGAIRAANRKGLNVTNILFHPKWLPECVNGYKWLGNA